jgi:hypothetical protein
MKQTFLDEHSTSASISDLLITSNSTLLAVQASYDIKSRQDVAYHAVANHQQRVAKRGTSRYCSIGCMVNVFILIFSNKTVLYCAEILPSSCYN